MHSLRTLSRYSAEVPVAGSGDYLRAQASTKVVANNELDRSARHCRLPDRTVGLRCERSIQSTWRHERDVIAGSSAGNQRVWVENFQVYDVRNVCRPLNQGRIAVAPCGGSRVSLSLPRSSPANLVHHDWFRLPPRSPVTSMFTCVIGSRLRQRVRPTSSWSSQGNRYVADGCRRRSLAIPPHTRSNRMDVSARWESRAPEKVASGISTGSGSAVDHRRSTAVARESAQHRLPAAIAVHRQARRHSHRLPSPR